jgi:hypothetical protein
MVEDEDLRPTPATSPLLVRTISQLNFTID